MGLFSNPLVILLLAAALLSAAFGEGTNALVIAIIISLSVTLNFLQTNRSQQAAAALRRRAATTATVLRGGVVSEIALVEVVPGDVFLLSAGKIVPADGRLLEAKDLFIDQAMLTGESLPAEKFLGNLSVGAKGLDEATNSVFAGTSVVSGIARALAVHTCRATSFGKVADALVRKPPPTEFERGMSAFSMLILRLTIVLVVFAFLVLALFRHQPLEAFLFAIALAVGLTPEFLPMIVTITLGRGAQAMARHGVIVKQLQAIENFGSIDILASDKTGTLTEGRVELASALDAFGDAAPAALAFAALNSAHETGMKNPLDAAIVAATAPEAGWRKLDEVPFDFHRRRLSVVLERGGERLLVVKGALEGVLSGCSHYMRAGQVLPLDDTARLAITATNRQVGEQGLRVIAVARRAAKEQATYGVADERDLVFEGLLTFKDPPRDDAAATIRALAADGIRTVILTGDNEWVTRSVCHSVGISAERVLLGPELANITDEALPALTAGVDVYARLTPEQKVRVIRALKRAGHVVGFLGDGINDGPALREADVGISVDTAADVAQAAAPIILLRPGLDILHQGVLEGRRSFVNVIKYILMGTSSNFGNMFSMAGAAVLLPFLPMLPTQILLNNLLYDLSQLAIPSDNVDADDGARPRRWDVGFIQRFMLFMGPVSSVFDFLTFGMLYFVFAATPAMFQTGWFVESLLTQTLVIFVIRTRRAPWKSLPSTALIANVLLVCLVAVTLPYTPLAHFLGLVPLPLSLVLALFGTTAAYLGCAEVAKRLFYGHQPATT
jgi:Mg2+-importing ATPase